MCGIIGYIGKEKANEVLIKGLKILENRGYDSAGIATINQDEFLFEKAISDESGDAIEKLQKESSKFAKQKIGIAHTRWATHGEKSISNAHPHFDNENRIALVHNGVIENSSELKEELIKNGFNFHSETDTEVIANLLGRELKNSNMEIALPRVLSQLKGTWGLAILDKLDNEVIYIASHGSPIAVGVNKDEIFIASEPSAFQEWTNEFLILEEGEWVSLRIGQEIKSKNGFVKIEGEKIPDSPNPFPHWTLKEIFEQPEAMSRSMNFGGRFLNNEKVKLGGLEQNREELIKIEHLIIVACGTSKFAGICGSHFMRYLGAFKTVQVIDASEMRKEYLIEGSGVLAISQSGETKDVHRVVKMAKDSNKTVFSLVNKVNSLIARETHCGVYLNAGHEIGVASTKAFTTQVTVLALIAIWFAQEKNLATRKRKELIQELHGISMKVGSLLRISNEIEQLAKELKNTERGFILGKYIAEAIAKESALKIKEISYIHMEAYGGGELKHGPFALIEKDMPIILILPEDENLDLMITVAEEVKARGARVIAITDKKTLREDLFHKIVELPKSGLLTSFLAIIPMQLLAYYLSTQKGFNPDKPRNLAKAVTVD